MAAQAPEGYKLPYSDRNQGPLLLRVVWVNIGIAGTIAAIRFATKWRKTRRIYYDDMLVLLALAFGIVNAAQITEAVHYGLGRHIAYLTAEQRAGALKSGIFTLLTAWTSPMLGRIGFLTTLMFLSGTDPRVKKWSIWVFIVAQVLVNGSALIVFYTQCGSHLYYLWDPRYEELALAVCKNPQLQTDYGYFTGAVNSATDAYMAILPAVLIEHTRLSMKSKIGLGCLLCLSVLALIASIVKTYEARALSMVIDYTYDLCPYVIWISIELNVVIIVSSIPLIRPMFQRNPHRPGVHQMQRWDTSTVGSYLSKKGARSNLERIDSQENIIEGRNPFAIPGDNIHVTTEVSVTYEPSNMPFVHAALVGLVQGEISNPKLARS